MGRAWVERERLGSSQCLRRDNLEQNETKGKPVCLVNSNLTMTIDENGMPSMSFSTSWLVNLLGVCAYYVKRLFTRNKEKEERYVNNFRMFLERLQVRIALDPVTEMPTFGIVLLPSAREEPQTRHLPSSPETDAKPIVVKNQGSTIIYNIQNITINITTEVVTQLNMNPQQVVNHFHGQIKEALDKAVQQKFPAE